MPQTSVSPRRGRTAHHGPASWCARGLAALSSAGLAVRGPAGTVAPQPLVRLAMVWLGLVAVVVLGRLMQPAWNVTPCTAVALVAGALFPSPLVAASVPLAGLAVSNVILPGYGSLAMAAVVFCASAWPVLLRRLVKPGKPLGLGAGALVSAVVFFLSTNLAYWWLSNDYPHTISGLGACFVAALPFFRWMPAGDVAWTLVLAHSLAAVGHLMIAGTGGHPAVEPGENLPANGGGIDRPAAHDGAGGLATDTAG